MQITPTESVAEEVSFEWSNRKISSIKTEIRHSIIYKGWCEKVCWIVDERMKQKKKNPQSLMP